ncbi:glyoxylase-like metal-dependent hydrolase (beta-lactamase superfamily II) [Melghirimyces profundicolus]|uniref:Glyoxylase-like metal-dependent hydrolase (Beta-lactamase superfamily II) n=1 Tax=Melghirimyces profundicolus TaxID=1242148 RepID=A0A2T6BSZ9_9BACL|nr:MBL fold metallo-hydrolase [Melghirimyces profundicolus]PTX59087.1 glyoxylase-like metal-dependent hydrolase (beta-lactamase superfamily II) [Melghirimyces profundicolus]
MNRWEDIWEVPLPLPFPLKIIKSYLLKGSNGYTVVDTGLHYEGDIEAWEEAGKTIGFDWNEVERIVLTHYHPDHYGLAGWMQRQTGAPVKMSRTDFEQASLFWDEDSDQPEEMARFYAGHGLSSEWVEKIPEHLRGFTKWVQPHPEPEFIRGGETIRLGDREYRILHTPGHADGHLSFYDEERGWLIGGDFLLPKITPNISLWPGCDPDPLRTYLNMLEEMDQLPVKKVFPAHGPAFEHYHERIEELRRHHGERLERMKGWVKGKGANAVEVCCRMFGKNLTIHNLRFALSETLAHLEYLRLGGELVREKEAGVWIYRTTA